MATRHTPSRSAAPILVTGSHRSGSTWAGRMIASARGVRYVHEPFNPKAFDPRVCAHRFDREFSYVCDDNADTCRDALARCLWPETRTHRRVAPSLHGALSVLAGVARGGSPAARPLVKDPHAVFSAEWLARTFGMQVVVLIRHPAAFVGSLKVAGWTFRFDQLVEQPLLLRDHLGDLEAEIRRLAVGEGDLVDQGILLWNAIHRAIARYRARHPDWIFVRHEDLARDPVARFADVFAALGLPYTARARRTILRHSGPANPVEQRSIDGIRRNSPASVATWRSRLEPSEVERIRRDTEPVARLFYAEAEW